MIPDMNAWLRLVKEQVDTTADEDLQRRAWFGHGPEADSPDERFNKFLGDAAIKEFLEQSDTGLSEEQIVSLQYLTKLISDLCEETNKEGYLAPTFIDDPRWQRVIKVAKETKKLLAS